jgi:hypothetical protein
MGADTICPRAIKVVLLWLFVASAVAAADLDPKLQPKVDARIQTATTWAANPAIVNAVKAQNQQVPNEFKAMTQEQWASTAATEHLVRQFTQNAAAEYLKAQRDAVVTEAFVSDADGRKVAFLAKPTSWIHKGKPKHDVPMSGKTWQGKVEMDDSTGFSQLQIAVPVLDAGKPIGSLVVGLNITKLGE